MARAERVIKLTRSGCVHLTERCSVPPYRATAGEGWGGTVMPVSPSVICDLKVDQVHILFSLDLDIKISKWLRFLSGGKYSFYQANSDLFISFGL